METVLLIETIIFFALLITILIFHMIYEIRETGKQQKRKIETEINKKLDVIIKKL